MQFGGFFVNEKCDRHPPGALTRNTPVRAIVHHAFDARLTPGRTPLDGVLNFIHRLIQQACLIHADKPLRRRTENNRRFMAPAVRVAVRDVGFFHQCTALIQNAQYTEVTFIRCT